MQKRPLTNSRPLAIALTCAASFLFAFLDTGAKYLATVAHMPVLQIIWVRFMVNTLLIVVMLGPRQVRRALPSNKLMNQLLRSVFLIGATAFNFLALQHLQLDQTATIFFLSPFIVAAFAGPMLGEWIGWHRILAICVGFTGVLFVTRPGFGNIHWAVSFSLLATLSYALYRAMTDESGRLRALIRQRSAGAARRVMRSRRWRVCRAAPRAPRSQATERRTRAPHGKRERRSETQQRRHDRERKSAKGARTSGRRGRKKAEAGRGRAGNAAKRRERRGERAYKLREEVKGQKAAPACEQVMESNDRAADSSSARYRRDILCYNYLFLWTRYLARFDSARTTLVYTPLAGAVFVAPLAFASWQMPVGIWVWSVLLSLGLLGGLGHWLLILAHERAPAPILAPFGYISIVFMIALGFTVFGDVPSWWTLIGAAIIILSGVYLLFRERYGPGSAPASSATVVEG